LYSFGLKYNLVLFSSTNDAPNEWSLSHANNFNEYISNYTIGAALNRAKDQKIAILLTIPINLTYKSLIRHFTPELKDRIKITIHNQPIGLTEQLLTFVSIIFGWFVSCLLLIPITIPFLRASYVLFPIHERITITTNDRTFKHYFLGLQFSLRYIQLHHCFLYYIHSICYF
jgi:hypothetical protein